VAKAGAPTLTSVRELIEVHAGEAGRVTSVEKS
jgi:hypothetical protein